jgi:hypothetical protein
MKFQLLAIGARFEFEGKEYVKTGPLTASSDGVQRMIPRFAVLKPLDASVEPARKTQRNLDEVKVLAAFETFFADSTRVLQMPSVDADQVRAGLIELTEARQRFLDQIALPTSTDQN